MKKMKLNIQLFGASVSLTASATSATDETAINTNQNYINLAIRVQTTKPTWNGNKTAYYQVTTTSQNNGTQTGSKYYFSIGSSTGSGDKTFNVTLGPFDHNADGTLNNVSVSVYVKITDSTNRSASTSVAMGTIPRASQPRLSNNNVNMGTSLTIYTDRVSTSFTHTIRFAFGNASGTIATNVADSVSWTPSIDLAHQIPSAVSGYGEIYCDTYSNGVVIGTKAVGITLNVPSNIVPSVSFTQVQESGDVPTSWGVYVKSKSRVALAISGSGAYSSSIASHRISYYGGAVTTASATTSYLTQAGSTTFTGQVTDTRGRSASTTTTINVVDYSNPTISTAQVQRCDIDGNIDNNGEYMFISYGASISSCSSQNTPSAVYKVGYRVHNTGSYQYVSLATNANNYSASGMLFSDGIKASTASGTKVQFSSSNTYDIQFYVKDYFMEYTNVQSLDTGFDLMNFNPSGKAMAIGKVSEAGANEELLEIGINTTIDGITTINTPENQYSTIKLKPSNRGESSIAYYDGNGNSQFVAGFNTGSSDKWSIYSETNYMNVLGLDRSGNLQIEGTLGSKGIYTTGNIDTQGNDLVLGSYPNTNDTGDILWKYLNNNEKTRIWFENSLDGMNFQPNFRAFSENGNQIFSGKLLVDRPLEITTQNILQLEPGFYLKEGSSGWAENGWPVATWHATLWVWGSSYGADYGWKTLICVDNSNNEIWLRSQQWSSWSNWKKIG